MGAYKPLLSLHGRPLVAWAADALRPLVGEVLVAHGAPANARALAAALPDARLVADPSEGPLGGLVAAAREAKGTWLLVAPADAPFLTQAVYETLLRATEGHEGAVFVEEGHVQALVAVYRREALLRAAEDARSPREAAAHMRVAYVDAGPLAPFLRDADTPEDVETFRREPGPTA